MPTRPLRTRATAAVAVHPVTVTDRTAPLVLGLEPRAFRELVAREAIPHARIGHRVVARVDDVLAALERLAVREQPPSDEKPVDDEPVTADAVLARIGRRRVGP